MNTVRTRTPLDGSWTVLFDPDNRGIRERWFASPPETGTKPISLPTMQAQDIATNGGVGWFIHHFQHEESAPDSCAILHVEAFHYPSEVWLNGTRLGDHPGGGAPAQFPVTAHLRAGENPLALRLATGSDPAPHTALYPLDSPGQVSLAFLPRAHVEEVFLQPDVRRKRLVVTVEAPGDCAVHLQIEGTSCHVQGAPGELILEFPEFELWSPETPRLYLLRVDLTTPDGHLDTLGIPFGMREFTVKDGRFYLNNRPIYLKAVCYRAQYPATLRADKLDLLLKRELDLVKSSGFNAVRVEAGPAPARFVALASEIGLLVLQEVPDIAGIRGASAALEALVFRDRNAAALACWCGLPARELSGGLVDQLRTLDPSRLILCDAAVDAPQWLFRPYRDTPEPCDTYSTAAATPLNALAAESLRLSGGPEQLNCERGLSSGGAVQGEDTSPAGAAAAERFAAEYESRQLGRCFSDPAKFFEASQALQAEGTRAQMDAIRSNTRMMGYAIQYLCDGPGTAPLGLADSKRHPKPALKSLRQIQQDVRPVIQMQKCNLTPREEVGVTILLINEARIEGRGELSLQVVGPTNQVLWKKKRLVKIPRHGRELWVGDVAASGSSGPHKFVVRLTQDRRVIGENAVNIHVVQPLKTEPVEIHVPGGRGALRSACGKLARLGNLLAPVHVVPPLANTIRAYPANELMQVLAQVAEGAVAIVFQPPADWNDLAVQVDPGLTVHSRPLTGRGVVAHHYAKLHPVFDGLPSRDLMQQPYQNVVPLHAFESAGDEEMSGVYCRTPGGDDWWGANFAVRRLGAGRVVFTHLRILEHLGQDPVADRLFVNLLQHFSRRSVPATELASADQKTVEWLNQERNTALHKWMVLGSFPNWGGQSGHDNLLPPENEINLDATYPGWYRALQWKPWWTRESGRHHLDFHAALDADTGNGAPCRYGTAFAYAEFSCDRRQEVLLALEGAGQYKAWLNGTPVLHPDDADASDGVSGTGWVKQGKNTLLIKCSKGPGPYTLSTSLEPVSDTPLLLNWWK